MTERSLAHRRSPTAAAALLLVGVSTLSAQPTESPVTVRSTPSEAAGAVELRVEGEAVHLALDEVVALALERNLGLRVQRYSREQARLGIQEAMGIYDLGLIGDASVSSEESPSASNLEGAAVQKQDRDQLTLGLSQLIPSGGTVQFSFSNSKLETNSQFFTINPSYNSGLDFSLSQPLLRNFGRDATEFGLRIAALDSDIAREGFVEQVVSTIAAAENAYWNLVAARFRLSVAEESLQLARQLHENNRVRVDVGTLAPLELVASEAGIATREEEIIRARAAIGDAEDVLRYLIDVDDARLWTMALVPETAAETEYLTFDLPEALATALDSRPELAREQLALRGREIRAAYYRSQTKPRLDLVARYGFNGVGGDVVVRDNQGNVVSRLPGGWDDALDQVTGADFPGWSVGLEFGMPLQNRSARARATSAELALEQGRVGLDQRRQVVEAEVRIAARGLETGRQEIESARVSVRLAESNLDAEKKKYENGLSTSFQILQVEEELAAARLRLVQAVTGYRRALVAYHQSIGKLLDYAGVTVAD
jgi:outer membrane protein TolC